MKTFEKTNINFFFTLLQQLLSFNYHSDISTNDFVFLFPTVLAFSGPDNSQFRNLWTPPAGRIRLWVLLWLNGAEKSFADSGTNDWLLFLLWFIVFLYHLFRAWYFLPLFHSCVELLCYTTYTKHKSHYPPGNHHASHLWECPRDN